MVTNLALYIVNFHCFLYSIFYDHRGYTLEMIVKK